MEQFRDAFLDEDEYGFSSLSKFLARNKKRILQKKLKKITMVNLDINKNLETI